MDHTDNFSGGEMSRYYDEQAEFLPEHRNGYGTYPGKEERSDILRNKEEYRPVTHQLHTGPSFVSETSEDTATCQSCLDGLVRPCFAEFFAVFVTIFLSIHVDHELSERHVLSIHRISLLSIIDGMLACIFISAFKTVHLHPLVTMANLFSLATSWFLCLLILITQLIAALLAVTLIAAQRSSGIPADVSLNNDVNSDWIKQAYRLMFSQFIGTLLVVITHLMSYQSERKGSIRVGKLSDTPFGIFMAITISSFLSLLHSTLNWNSLIATSIALIKIINGSASQSILDQHIFWLGPVVGALLAGFLYRLLYAPDDRRFIRCCEQRETHIL